MINQIINKKNIYACLQQKFLIYNPLQFSKLSIGNMIEIDYKILYGNKEKIKKYKGIIISKQKNNFNKSFTIRRFVEGIGVEQIFIYNSPQILQLRILYSYKISKAKLYYLRKSLSKSIKLKRYTRLESNQ
jgi:large subunit ribosomal protein L19